MNQCPDDASLKLPLLCQNKPLNEYVALPDELLDACLSLHTLLFAFPSQVSQLQGLISFDQFAFESFQLEPSSSPPVLSSTLGLAEVEEDFELALQQSALIDQNL